MDLKTKAESIKARGADLVKDAAETIQYHAESAAEGAAEYVQKIGKIGRPSRKQQVIAALTTIGTVAVAAIALSSRRKETESASD